MVQVSQGIGDFILEQEGSRPFLVQDHSRLIDRLGEPELVVEGTLQGSLALDLPANALVDRLEVIVTARPASATLAAAVAQLRLGASGQDLVVDFGTPRTVSMIRPAGGFTVATVKSWNGMAFTDVVPRPLSRGTTAVLSEVRTERLQLLLNGNGDAAELIAGLLLVLPDAPSDLELRIDGGPPVWRHPGAVRLEPGTALGFEGFNEDGQRLVDLAAAFGALTGDPLQCATRSFRLELTSRSAGRLNVAAPAARRSLRRIWRARIDGEAEPRIGFEEEGPRSLLPQIEALPAEAVATELRLTVKGAPLPQRAVPPVGPEASDLAEIIVDPNRAAIIRLAMGSRLGLLNALRLPLAAGAGGAEATVALWSSNQAGVPDQALPKGTSQPVALDAGPERWVTFPFAAPVAMPVTPLWAALLVARGSLVWRPTAIDPADADQAAGTLRTGAQAGPWYGLPALFAELPGNPFGRLRGRVRLFGTPAAETPIAAASFGAGAATVEATPGDSGLRVIVPVSGGAALSVVAGAAMLLSLSEIDLVTTG